MAKLQYFNKYSCGKYLVFLLQLCEMKNVLIANENRHKNVKIYVAPKINVEKSL